MRWIYISPHFDDAVLSCGGLIYEQTRQGNKVETWTVCGGYPPPGELSPLAQVCHFQWGTTTGRQTVSLRRKEDRQAAAILGARTHHFRTPDCIYRRSAEGEQLYIYDVFSDRHPYESNLDLEISRELASALHPEDILVCPLTIGRHLDHVLTRAAVERLGRHLWYYADIPYLLDHPEELAPATRDMNAEFFPVSEAGLQVWQAGIAAYKSQMMMLFETNERMLSGIRGYWEAKLGIHLWKQPPAAA